MGGYKTYWYALYKLLKKSNSKFTIGICGDWGRGKTTFMDSVYKLLDNIEDRKNITPIWFNTWQYEKERNLQNVSSKENDNDKKSPWGKIKSISTKSHSQNS